MAKRLDIIGGSMLDSCYSRMIAGQGEVTWNVTTMWRDAIGGLFGDPVWFPMDKMPKPDYSSGNIDLLKVAKIKANPAGIDTPALAIANDENDIIAFCDGNHRLTARHELGRTDFWTFIVPHYLETQYRIIFLTS